jgi:hypothetical protein
MNIKEEKYFIFQAEDTGYVEGETHGLIAAPFDAPTADPRALIIWGCRYNLFPGADGTVEQVRKTRDIESGCSDEGGADFLLQIGQLTATVIGIYKYRRVTAIA